MIESQLLLYFLQSMSSSMEETARFLCIDRKQMYQVRKNGNLRINKVNGRIAIERKAMFGHLAQKSPNRTTNK